MKIMNLLTKVRNSTNWISNVNLCAMYLEIIEYAKFLGMDLDEDQDLMYIAEEGVSTGWQYNL